MEGFVKIAAAAPVVEVAHCSENIRRIESLMRCAAAQGVQIIVFPELAVTGYTCMDLFTQNTLQTKAEEALLQLVENTKDTHLLCAVGMPLVVGHKRFNTAVVFQSGRILGVVPKTYLPNYREFQETRWFTSGAERQSDYIHICRDAYPFGTNLLFEATDDVMVGVEICEDLWAPIPPSSLLAMQGANILLNLSASNEETGKNDYLRALVTQQSARCMAGYVYASAGFGESSTDLVYTGKGFIAENGTLLSESTRFKTEDELLINDIHIDYLQHDRLIKTDFTIQPSILAAQSGRFSPLPSDDSLDIHARLIPCELFLHTGTLTRPINPHPFIPSDNDTLQQHCEEICHIQSFGLVKRLKHIGCQSAVIGISGGLDSTLALLATVRAFDQLNIPRKNILGVTMPGFGTTGRTYQNAVSLIEALGVSLKEISIREACMQHFKDIGHDGQTPDITFENAQARERTQILMDLANLTNGIVVGTGDLSELALGWATYNGDHISMYNVNVGVPKTLVRYLIEWTANRLSDSDLQKILLDIADTPISPELTPVNKEGASEQKTEETVGPYELHDFFLYHFLRFGASPKKITNLAQLAFKEKYSKAEIQKWLRTFLKRFFSQQFKRSCLPDGPRIGSVSLSPRGDWRMPSDASVAEWLENEK